MKNNIYNNHSLEEYKIKFKKIEHNLRRFSQEEVDEYNKNNKKPLLKSRKWWLIEDTYYEVPKVFSWKWFSNLNVVVKATIGASLIVGSAAAIVLPISLTDPYREDVNTVYTLNSKIKNQNYSTCYDFVTDLYEKTKVDITNLEAKNASVEYAFDKENNRVILINKANLNIVYPNSNCSTNNIWRFVNTVSEDASYSQYIKDGYDAINNPTSFSVKSGVDVGNNDYFETINYKNDSQANNIIRTNGGALIITAPNDTVKHYGNAKNILINAVASNSYHEYGNVYSLSIASGRLVIEQEAEGISSINIVKQSDESITTKVSITVNNDSVSTSQIKKEKGVDSNIEDIVINNESKKEEVIEKASTSISVDDTDGDGQSKIINIIKERTDIDEIVLKSDIKVVINNHTEAYESGIDISRAITIEGNGYHLNGEESETVTDEKAKHRNVLGISAQNSTVNINNLNVDYDDSKNNVGYNQAIRIKNAFGSTINLNWVINQKNKYYAMFVSNVNDNEESLENTGVNVNINDCNLIGYSAIKCNGNYMKITANDSIITGVNDKGKYDSNYCSAIQIQYPIWNDTLNSNNELSFNNCTLTASYDPINNATETILECLSPLNNKIEFNGCNFNSSVECGHGENEYHYLATFEDDIADLNDYDIQEWCSNMGDSEFKVIVKKDSLFKKCPVIDYILVDGIKYGHNEDYTKDDRFKVGIIDDNADSTFPNY